MRFCPSRTTILGTLHCAENEGGMVRVTVWSYVWPAVDLDVGERLKIIGPFIVV